jgi:hypothetical protein
MPVQLGDLLVTVLPSPFAVVGAVVITLSVLIVDTLPSSLVDVVPSLPSSVVVGMVEPLLLTSVALPSASVASVVVLPPSLGTILPVWSGLLASCAEAQCSHPAPLEFPS